jgi:hypothetical protein
MGHTWRSRIAVMHGKAALGALGVATNRLQPVSPIRRRVSTGGTARPRRLGPASEPIGGRTHAPNEFGA